MSDIVCVVALSFVNRCDRPNVTFALVLCGFITVLSMKYENPLQHDESVRKTYIKRTNIDVLYNVFVVQI